LSLSICLLSLSHSLSAFRVPLFVSMRFSVSFYVCLLSLCLYAFFVPLSVRLLSFFSLSFSVCVCLFLYVSVDFSLSLCVCMLFCVFLSVCLVFLCHYPGNTKGGKYQCTIDLLLHWFGLICFAKKCQLSYSWFQTCQTGGQQYSDTFPFRIPCAIYLFCECLKRGSFLCCLSWWATISDKQADNLNKASKLE